MIVRVFPRRTSATPTDDYAFVGDPPPSLPSDIAECHVSCTFTWDIPEAQRLVAAWADRGFPVRLGGPAIGPPPGDFVPGQYLATGKVITSRGCIRACPHCIVSRREGLLRTLPIRDGWDICDNNLLACPRDHIEAVLDMLGKQRKAARFTGGLDARILPNESWFMHRLSKMRVGVAFTAYDSEAGAIHAQDAIRALLSCGLTRRKVYCYVLMGFEDDRPEWAEKRCESIWEWGGLPFAMFYRAGDAATGTIPQHWRATVRKWSRQAAIFSTHKEDKT